MVYAFTTGLFTFGSITLFVGERTHIIPVSYVSVHANIIGSRTDGGDVLSGAVKRVANRTHKAHATFVLSHVHPTSREGRVALFELADRF
jgi:hypothetical protein